MVLQVRQAIITSGLAVSSEDQYEFSSEGNQNDI